jgi:hypothetical protein
MARRLEISHHAGLMKAINLGEALASRTIRFQPAVGAAIDVVVSLGMPIRDDSGREWLCPFEISGIRDEAVRAAFGVDAMQALVLALHVLPTELRAIAREESGTFPNGDEDFGLTQACHMHLR